MWSFRQCDRTENTFDSPDSQRILVRNEDSGGIANDLVVGERQCMHSLAAAESHNILTDICISYLFFAEFEEDPLTYRLETEISLRSLRE
jgi:hypothetical protein